MKVNVRNPRDVHFWYDTEGGTHLSYTTVDPPPRQIPIYSMMEGGATWPEYTLHEHYQRLEIIAAENIGGANLFNRSLEFQPDDAQEWLDSIRYNPDTDIWCLDEEGPAYNSLKAGHQPVYREFRKMRNFFFSHSSNLILYNLITPDANKNNNVHASKCLEGTRAIWSDCYIKDATEASIQKCVDVTRECLRIRSLMTTKPEIWLGVTPRYFITEENQHTLGHRMIHTDVLREALARCLSTTDETGFSPSAVIVWSGDYWYYGKEAGDNWAQAARNRVHALESQHYELPYIPGDRDAMFQFINTTDLQMLKNIRTALTPERP